MTPLRLCYLSIFGQPGTYDRTVFDGIEGGDNECVWFQNNFGHLPGVSVHGYRVTDGEPVPDPGDGDLFILGGSYNSVHDGYPWQTTVYRWLEKLWAAGKPLLAICGGHQMVSHMRGAGVEKLPGGVIAGTEPVRLNEHGLASPLFAGLESPAMFHFGNQEQVTEAPSGAKLLASHRRVAVAALDYGGGWFSTQFHPESGTTTFRANWRKSHPEYMQNYVETTDGVRLIENFIDIARA